MIDKPAHTPEAYFSGSTPEGTVDWELMCVLLEEDQFEQAAQFLQALLSQNQEGAPTSDDRLLAAAHQVCLACLQCRRELEWHRTAFQESLNHIRELKVQLEALLDELSKNKDAATAESNYTPLPKWAPDIALKSGVLFWRQRLQKAWASLTGRKNSEISHELIPASLRSPFPDPAIDATDSHQEVPEVPIPRTQAHPKASSGSSVSEINQDRPVVEQDEEIKSRTPTLVVYCLGAFRVLQDKQPVSPWNGLKSQSIFKYLISLNGKPVAKDVLMDMFWPETDLESARRNLHQAVYSLRQSLRRIRPNYAHIQFENNNYFLNPEMYIWCDFQEFEDKVETGKRLKDQGQLAETSFEFGIAESIYQGDFLEEDLYDEWPRSMRSYLRETYLEISEWLIEYHLSRSEYTAASALCRKVLNRDNCREHVHRLLIQCYLVQGQRHLALRQYHICRQALKEELDLDPAEATLALYPLITMAK